MKILSQVVRAEHLLDVENAGLGTFVGDLRQRGKISSRPNDETLARLILDEYIRFPRETVQ